MKQVIRKHREFWVERHLRLGVFFSLMMLFLSLLVNYYANVYTVIHAGNAVTDIILDNIPVFDVDSIFVEGSVIFWVFTSFVLLWEPRRIPFVVKSIAVFILIRSAFIILTHIGPPSAQSFIEPNQLFKLLTAGSDMFFSSHTGLPFLMALDFWNQRGWRYFFLAASAIFAVSVLAGHLHYSIDVFAAFFITYSIFHITKDFFPGDFELSGLAKRI